MLTQNINNNGTQILGNDENETGGTLLIGGQTPDMEINFVGGLLTKDTEISGWVIEDKIKVPSGEADLYIAQKNGLKGVIKYYRGHIHPNLDLIEKLVNLNHPNIIKIYEYGKHNGHFYEIMEYAQGGSLDTRNDDGLYKYLPLSEDKVIQICKQIINSYKICHEKGIIHRDIKPANMYYRNTDFSDIVIGDFGISSLYGEEETIYHKTQTTSRTTGYAAPEVLSGIITPKMDYYALGISVWELLTGNDPFVLENGKRRNDAHLLRDTIEGRIVDDLLSREPRISDYMQHLIRGLLVVDEEKRWGYEEVTRYLNGEYVEVAKKEIKAWDYSIENISCTTLEQVGTAIFNNLKSEKLKKEVFRGFLTAFFEDIYPDVAKEMNQIIENSYSDIELCLKKIALLLNPSIPYITQNGYKIGNIDDIVELIQKVPEEMIDVLSEDNKWFYIYFEHLGYKDKIKDILNIMKGNKGKSGFTTMLNLGKIVVLLNNKTIKPFSDNKYKDMLLSDFNQLLNIPVDLQRIILDVIKNKSLEGFLLPWLLTVKPSLRINKINEWSDLVNLINNKDIVVSKDGVAEFSSVQSAINAADNGVTIYIEAGVYEESLTINKKLSFIGSDRNEVIIQQPKKCVCEIHCESSFKNITFKNTEKNQEHIDSEIKKATFLDENIALVKCNSPVRFENCCFIDSFKNGIFFANSNGSLIEHCMISNSAYNGIYSQNSTLFITNVKIAFTGLFGLCVTGSGILKAESCEIYQTKEPSLYVSEKGTEITLTNCKIHDSQKSGIFASRGGKLIAYSCEVYEIKGSGASVFSVYGEETEITLTNCKIHDVMQGLSSGGSNCRLTTKSCEIYYSELGVAAINSSELILKNCKIHDINTDGLHITTKGKLVAESCEIYQIKEDGVSVSDEGTEITLTNCKIHNTKKGLSAGGTKCRITTESCEIHHSELGVAAIGSSELILKNCKIHDINTNGLHIITKGKLVAESCEIYKTKYAGIFIDKNEDHFELTDCKIHHTENGVGIEATSKNSIINISSDNFGEGISQNFKVREFESKAKKEGITVDREKGSIYSTKNNQNPKQKKLLLTTVLIINFILTVLISFHYIWKHQGFEDIKSFIGLMFSSITPSFLILLIFLLDSWFKLAFKKGVIPEILGFSPNSYDIGIRMEKSIKILIISMVIFNWLYLALLIYFDLKNITMNLKEFIVLAFIYGVQYILVLIGFKISSILGEYDWYRINWEKQDLNQ